MTRIPNNYINTSFFHIMIQGINKSFIFEYDEDVEKYIKILQKIKKEIDVKIIAYCVMINHVHLLIYTDNIENLVKFMHKTNLIYAKYYNKKHNRVGYVFRDRYKNQPIFSEKHLRACIDYIHNNPVKAKLCEKPSEYQYSSYNSNIFQNNTEIEYNICKYINDKKFNSNANNEFVFIETEDNQQEIYIEEINKFFMDNATNIKEIKNNRKLLKILVSKLKEEFKISYREMEKILGIGRETLRRLTK